jgi:quercetin dioxygenase-like cupin family protein
MDIAHIDQTKAQPEPSLRPYLEGEVRIQPLFSADSGNGQQILVVYFSPGARTRPHIHKHGQVLHILEGRGIVATETEKRVVSAGDVIVTPPGAWHWHGATRQTAMGHLALQGPEGDLVWDVELKDWASEVP